MNVRGSSVAMIRLNCAPFIKLKLITAFEFSALNRSAITVTRYLPPNGRPCPSAGRACATRVGPVVLDVLRKEGLRAGVRQRHLHQARVCQPLCTPQVHGESRLRTGTRIGPSGGPASWCSPGGSTPPDTRSGSS